MTSRRRTIVLYLAIFAVAAAARLGATFALHRWDDPGAGVNRQLAANLVEHGAYSFREFGYFGPSSVATPVYPATLAGLFTLFGGPDSPTAWFAALALNALLGAAAAVAAAHLVRRCGGGDTAGYASGFLIAVWPAQVLAAQFAQPMVMAGALALTACLLWRRALDRHGAGTWIAFAAAASAASMLVPALLPALLLAVVAVPFVRAWPGDVRMRNAVVLAAAAALIWLPWLARNATVHGTPVVTTRTWQSVWAAANPNATGSDRLRLTPERRAATAGASLRHAAGEDSADAAPSARAALMQADLLTPRQRSELSGQTEANREALFAAWAGEAWRDGTSPWLAQLPVRLAKAWAVDWDHPMSRHPLAMVPRAVAVIAATAAVAIFLSRRRGAPAARGAGAMLAVMGSAVAVQGLTLASAKLSVVIEPVQLAFAATILCHARLPRFSLSPRPADALHDDDEAELPLVPSDGRGPST